MRRAFGFARPHLVWTGLLHVLYSLVFKFGVDNTLKGLGRAGKD